MGITAKDIQYIADLARIYVPEEKRATLTHDLVRIIQYVELLQTLDVEHVKPTSHAVSLGNVLREDTVKPSLTHAQVMRLAVESKSEFFKVPLIIE